MTCKLVEYSNRQAQADALANLVADTLREQLTLKGRATIAVAGGSTPAEFLTKLGTRDLDWSQVTVLPTDERWAPPDHERSNERMIRATLMANGAKPQLFSYWRMGQTAHEAAPRLADALAPSLPIDICVLGMGADMHCASLFPHGDGLDAAMSDGAPAVAAITAPGAPEPRVTLSAEALASGDLHLLISGDEKRRALDTALAATDPLIAPVAGVLRRNGAAIAHWAP